MRNMFRALILYFAEFKNNQRQCSERKGIALAKLRGKYKGREQSLTPDVLKKIDVIINFKRVSKLEIAKALGMLRTTFYKGLRTLEANKLDKTRNPNTVKSLVKHRLFSMAISYFFFTLLKI